MTTPATNRQIPDHAILDHFNKQAYLGNAFLASSGSISIASKNTETAILVIQNPAVTATSFPVSSLGVFNGVRKLFCNSTAAIATFKFYKNPTGVSGGSAITPINLRFASGTVSITTVTKSPTVVGNGTLISSIQVGVSRIDDSTLLVIDPGSSMLITVTTDTDTTAVISEIGWYEL